MKTDTALSQGESVTGAQAGSATPCYVYFPIHWQLGREAQQLIYVGCKKETSCCSLDLECPWETHALKDRPGAGTRVQG